jgi:hypothetical protein
MESKWITLMNTRVSADATDLLIAGSIGIVEPKGGGRNLQSRCVDFFIGKRLSEGLPDATGLLVRITTRTGEIDVAYSSWNVAFENVPGAWSETGENLGSIPCSTDRTIPSETRLATAVSLNKVEPASTRT